MANHVADLLAHGAAAGFVGRSDELSLLTNLLDNDPGLLVVHVHGIAGIGKSTLLTNFTARARSLCASDRPRLPVN